MKVRVFFKDGGDVDYTKVHSFVRVDALELEADVLDRAKTIRIPWGKIERIVIDEDSDG